MRMINKFADRMLTAFVPKAAAGACCVEQGSCYFSSTGCPTGRLKRCCFDCNCRAVCGACEWA
ncbi:hypothetical protein [Micromonospora cathayae]|uniref:Bacteriocin-type signal sequence-containing protein n=1 Tax=Micromonospora cathayae TaxID=3028804 RepID=A0ABY7ZJA4_9ACTN|nr:hypothetical protein [Micromonospora sp. HUAS 3]WDZ82861.1 hypothetical protein PVK37_20575 [Micromonospora sp. HUAS 3]